MSARGPVPAREAPHAPPRPARRPGPGEALPAGLRRRAEASTATDLGRVRLHRDAGAEAVTSFAGAKAAQWDDHIFIRPDAYAPDTEAGLTLLGHELLHSAQTAAFGPGPSGFSTPGTASEAEADRLAPAVLEGVPGSAVPEAAPAARINRNGGGEGDATAVCRVDNLPDFLLQPEPGFTPLLDPAPGTDSERENESGEDTVNPYLDSPFHPDTVEVTTLTNRGLIEEAANTARELAAFNQTSPESQAYEDLSRRLEEERGRRVEMGYVFLASAQTGVPEHFVQLRPDHPMEGATAIMIADPELALGQPTVLLNGILLVPEQLDAYLESARQLPVEGAQAQRALRILETGNMQALTREFEEERAGSRVIGSGSLLSPYANQQLSFDTDLGQMLRTTDLSNAIGRTGEVFSFYDARTGFGMGARDLNRQRWRNVAGVNTVANAPVFDLQNLFDPLGRYRDRGPRLTSVAATQTTPEARMRFLTNKVAQMVDAHNRGPLPDAEAALRHLRETSRRPDLATTDVDFASVRETYLPDTFYAVPDAQVADIRAAIASPDSAPFGGRTRAITRPAFQALYDDALARQAITVERADGSPVEIRSLADLATMAPQHNSLPRSMRGGRELAPQATRLSEAQYNSVLLELGQRASGTIVSATNAADLRGSMDTLRGVGDGGPAPTRILEVRRGQPGDNLARIRDAVTHTGPGLPSGVRDVAPRGGDRFLSAVNMHMAEGAPVTRHDSDFATLRREMTSGAEIQVPRGEAARLREHILTSDSADAQAVRAAIAADHPDLTVDEYLGRAVTEFSLSATQLQGQGAYHGHVNTLAARSGSSAEAHLNPDVMHAYQNPYIADGRVNFEAVRYRAGRSVGMNAGTAAYGQVLGNYWNHWVHDEALRDFDTGQLLLDTGIGFVQDETQILAARGLSHVAIENAATRSFVGQRAMPAVLQAGFASVQEMIAMAQMERELLEGEFTTRVGRSAGIGLVGAGAGMAAEAGTLYIIGSFAAAGTSVGPVGTVVGVIVGATVATVVIIELDRNVGGSGAEFDAEYARRERARQLAELEERMRQPLGTFQDDRVPLPVAPSPDISAAEQMAIARFFMAQTRRGGEDEFTGPRIGDAMVCMPDPEALVCMP